MNPRQPATRKSLFLLVAAACSTTAMAQRGGVVSEHDYFEELPVVLSVSRLSQPLNEAPGAVTVIDREMIRQSGARELVDLLRLVPGFQVASLPGLNGPPVAVYHGLAESYPRHMQVLLDGRSQYSPFFVGGVNWSLVPVSLDDIDHIEVIRGSNSAAYGSNAVLGVVNIVTRSARETQGVTVEASAGTDAVNDKRIRLGAGGQDFSIRYTAETSQDDGFVNYRDSGKRRLNDVRADWRLGLRDELQLQLGETTTTQQMGVAGDVSRPLRNQVQSQQYLQVGWRRVLSEGEEVAVRYYRSEERAADAFSFKLYDAMPTSVPVFAFLGIPDYLVPVDYGFSSVRDNLEATHTFSPWRDTRLVWGGELRTDAVKSATYFYRSDAVSQRIGRLFGNIEWRLNPAWIANAGATWEADSNSKTTFAPRLALNWHATPEQTLRIAVARAYRTPSLFETRGNYVVSSSTGVTLLRDFYALGGQQPEVVTSRELGWLGDFKLLRLTGDVRVFEERLSDRLIGIPTNLVAPNCETISLTCGEADNAYNVQDVRIRGIEYQWRWQPREATRLIFNQSFIRMSADMHLPTGSPSIAATYLAGSEIAKDSFQAANSAPTHATTLMLMQKLPGGFDLSATYHSIGAMKWSKNTNAQHWQRLDWRLAYPFRMGPTRGELAFTVQSDGKSHVEHAGAEAVTTRSFVTLRLDY